VSLHTAAARWGRSLAVEFGVDTVAGGLFALTKLVTFGVAAFA